MAEIGERFDGPDCSAELAGDLEHLFVERPGARGIATLESETPKRMQRSASPFAVPDLARDVECRLSLAQAVRKLAEGHADFRQHLVRPRRVAPCAHGQRGIEPLADE